MVSLATTLERVDGVTFVSLHVENPDRARTVRVVNRLDGPCWPPRRQGRPAEGWDEDGYEGVVEADSTLALGYASPAPPADPPAEIEAVGPAPNDGTGGDAALDSETPESVLRSLGDPVVPREAVPVEAPGGDEQSGPATGSVGPVDRSSNDEAEVRSGDSTGLSGVGSSGVGSSDTADGVSVRATGPPGREADGHTATEEGGVTATPSVVDRLAAIERRLAALESR